VGSWAFRVATFLIAWSPRAIDASKEGPNKNSVDDREKASATRPNLRRRRRQIALATTRPRRKN
jgi:hypothetical protein